MDDLSSFTPEGVDAIKSIQKLEIWSWRSSGPYHVFNKTKSKTTRRSHMYPHLASNFYHDQKHPIFRIDIPWPPPIFSAFPWGDLHGCCPPSHRPRRRLELEIQGGDPPELAIDGYNKHLISKWETTWNTKVSQKKQLRMVNLSITILVRSAAKHFTYPTSLGRDCKSFLDSAACGKTLSKLRRRTWKVGKSSVMRQVFGNFNRKASISSIVDLPATSCWMSSEYPNNPSSCCSDSTCTHFW